MLNFIKKIFSPKKTAVAKEPLSDLETVLAEERRLKAYLRQYDPLNVDSIAEDDYLGLAASAKHRAKIAIQEKNYELAWKLYSEQKMHYFRYAEAHPDQTNTIALAGDVSFDQANVLRLEKNHTLALVHLIYSIATNPFVAYKMKKLPAYYNRAKLDIDFEEVLYFVYEQQKNLDFRLIQSTVYNWAKK